MKSKILSTLDYFDYVYINQDQFELNKFNDLFDVLLSSNLLKLPSTKRQLPLLAENFDQFLFLSRARIKDSGRLELMLEQFFKFHNITVKTVIKLNLTDHDNALGNPIGQGWLKSAILGGGLAIRIWV